MIKGLYSAFNGMDAAFRYQEVLSNNIANANTTGYKREIAANQAFDDVLISQQAAVPAPFSARIQEVVGTVGTGKYISEFMTDYAVGSFQQTGEELDFALEDGFFSVQDAEGETYYTRDGRFGRDANGDLVTSHGHHVLGADGQPINLPDGRVAVDSDGTIRTTRRRRHRAIRHHRLRPRRPRTRRRSLLHHRCRGSRRPGRRSPGLPRRLQRQPRRGAHHPHDRPPRLPGQPDRLVPARYIA
ncbi:MAG: flagellar hook-basal body protein [Dehalococcoidia bacterium]|nr:flagellar hook-basal body protein [Dehalococcoidia bacterium]